MKELVVYYCEKCDAFAPACQHAELVALVFNRTAIRKAAKSAKQGITRSIGGEMKKVANEDVRDK